jgi:CHAT domain-containing protein
LAPTQALIAYTRFEYGDVPAYLALILQGGENTPVVVPLGAAEEIEKLIAALSEQLTEVGLDPTRSPRQAEARYRRVAKKLRTRIWDPVSRNLGGTERILVVPDGALNLVNLATLPIAGSKYLIESGLAIHYLSAERDLIRVRENGMGKGLLGFGDPDFDVAETGERNELSLAPLRGTRSSCGAFQTLSFDSLPETGKELREVASLWTKAGTESSERDRGEAKLVTGSKASETNLETLAPGYRVLHLATHGFFLQGACGSFLDELLSPYSGESPLLLTGLALAGANEHETVFTRDDGILTAEEVATLRLGTVELAVLSACDTGTGEIATGEGVIGLRRAFRAAGARTMIMSLWSVEDESARRWMQAFYSRWLLDGLELDLAVQRASLDVLEDRRAGARSTHPFFWGAFVASGDPGTSGGG